MYVVCKSTDRKKHQLLVVVCSGLELSIVAVANREGAEPSASLSGVVAGVGARFCLRAAVASLKVRRVCCGV